MELHGNISLDAARGIDMVLQLYSVVVSIYATICAALTRVVYCPCIKLSFVSSGRSFVNGKVEH